MSSGMLATTLSTRGLSAVALLGMLTVPATARHAAALGEDAAGRMPRIERAAQALSISPLYVDPEAFDVLTPQQQANLSDRLRRSRTPTYVAVLTADTLAEAGDPGTLVAEIQRAAGDRPGTYGVVVDETFTAGSTVIGRQAAAIADRIAGGSLEPAQRIISFADQVEFTAMEPPTQLPIEPGASQERASGLPVLWVLLGAGGLLLAWPFVAKRRRRSRERDDLHHVRRTVDDDITSYGASLRSLDRELSVSAADRTATATFAHAHESYERAKNAATRVGHLDDARAVTAALEEGWYAIASAHAHHAGRPVPEHRPPCLFDPRHGPAAAEVPWAPGADGELRAVPACHADVLRLAEGRAPESRMVSYGGGRRPYWETGPSYAPWAEGWYDDHGPLLYAALWDTPLGEAWDDPAMATAESPFDGWSNDV